MTLISAEWIARFRQFNRSLVVRLIYLAMIMISIGLVLRIIVMISYLKEKQTDLAASRQITIAEYVAKDVDDRIRTRLDLIGNLARHLPPSLLQKPSALEAWLKEQHEIYPKFSRGLVVVLPNGQGALAEYPLVPGRKQLDFGASDWFVNALQERHPVIGRPFLGRADQVPLIIMSSPVLNAQGKVLAVLAGVSEIAAPDFLEQIQTRPIGKTGGFLLISPKDNLFVSADKPHMILKPLPKPGVNLLHDKAMAGYRGYGITLNAFGVEELSAIASVPVTGWFLVARVPTAEALDVIQTTIGYAFLATGIGGAAGILILLIILPRMFRPLTTASRQIHRMASGEIELQPVPLVVKDEVGDLVQGFNFLLTRLNEVTDQKLAQERLRLAERERMEESLRQWMADTSHELRTPISVMRAQIEAIQDGVHVADANTLAVLHKQTKGLSQLVDDLYTLARSDVGRVEGQNLPSDPLGLLDETVAAFCSRYADAKLAIDWKARPQEAIVVMGDPMRLKQVFSNILENTLRYSDQGGRLRIESAVVGRRAVFYFDDTPPGVPDEALERLFERFYRVDASRSREHGGSGIGLSVTVSLIEAMGGTIKAAHSDLGGLRLIISLPIMSGGSA